MATKDELSVRHYEPADYPMLEAWWMDHGAEPMDETMIPPSSCVVTMGDRSVAFGAVFLCNANHVAFFHGMVTRPGLSMAVSSAVLKYLQLGINAIMQSGGHTLLLGTVHPGAMVRGAKMMGFSPAGDLVQPVARIVPPLAI